MSTDLALKKKHLWVLLLEKKKTRGVFKTESPDFMRVLENFSNRNWLRFSMETTHTHIRMCKCACAMGANRSKNLLEWLLSLPSGRGSSYKFRFFTLIAAYFD